jgi:hypothetical protein
MSTNVRRELGSGNEGGLTFWFDIAVDDATLVEVCKTLEKLQCVYHYDLLIFDSPVVK